jgi:hypothetical protein
MTTPEPDYATMLRTRVGPGGDMEFIHAGGTVTVPPPPPAGMETSLRGAIFTATAYLRPTLFQYVDDDGKVREAVLISRARYRQLVEAERAAEQLREQVSHKDCDHCRDIKAGLRPAVTHWPYHAAPDVASDDGG